MDMLEETISELTDIRDRLARGVLFFGEINGTNSAENLFKNIRHFGEDPTELVVLSITPDGDGTVIGRFMKRDGSIYRFDFDLIEPKYSTIIKVDPTSEFGQATSLLHSELLEEIAGRYLLANMS